MFAYLSAISSFRFQVIEGNEFSEQAALLVAPLDPPQFEIGLWFEQDEPQVDGESCHVNSKRPVRIKHCFPSIHFASGVDLGGLIAQTSNKSYGPNRHLTCGAHLQRQRDKAQSWCYKALGLCMVQDQHWTDSSAFRAEVLILEYFTPVVILCSGRQILIIKDTVHRAPKNVFIIYYYLNIYLAIWLCVLSARVISMMFPVFLLTEWKCFMSPFSGLSSKTQPQLNVFCCCGVSTIRSDILCGLRCLSVQHSYIEWLFELP